MCVGMQVCMDVWLSVCTCVYVLYIVQLCPMGRRQLCNMPRVYGKQAGCEAISFDACVCRLVPYALTLTHAH
jgi:hypothetical protein